MNKNMPCPDSELTPYDYELPIECIAQEPLPDRTAARLMILDRKSGSIQHKHIRDFPDYLTPNDLMIINDTRVIPARLIGFRSKTGGHWEGLFLRFYGKDLWELMSKTRGKLQNGERISLIDPSGNKGEELEIAGRTENQTILVKPISTADPLDLLDRLGRVPIPPYIRSGIMNPSDKENYQTVYAAEPGAVAAPTAGLHFTKPLLEKIRQKGTRIASITLHVGAGTFRPITANRLEDHQMHAEYAHITADVVRQIEETKNRGGRIVAIGTTSVRALESASNLMPDGSIDSTGNNEFQIQAFTGETNLFIRPPYRFKTTDAMLTNFHLPKSTLLILVRTFGGDDLLKRAYQEAIQEKYRFYSYGDAMLIL
ncbi:MAG: tRNA preQ1(34) S-adenosylmethionine ribosyltransferase-isomerase QueA [Planctomycetia bacterium]|nr:tRNA preQ1(34) S-adenosylmethionine ribosyltransferase-isomerase QueA [Planctomycetia bacterium]